MPGERAPQDPMDRRLGGPKSWCRCGGEEKKIPSLPPPRIEPQSSNPQYKCQ